MPNSGRSISRFLQEVWNEAVVTNRKDVKKSTQIAWRHLYGESCNPDAVQPRSAAAQNLYENGLSLASPQETRWFSANSMKPILKSLMSVAMIITDGTDRPILSYCLPQLCP